MAAPRQATAHSLTEMLEANVADPDLWLDTTITLMHLYCNLPDFAGGFV